MEITLKSGRSLDSVLVLDFLRTVATWCDTVTVSVFTLVQEIMRCLMPETATLHSLDIARVMTCKSPDAHGTDKQGARSSMTMRQCCCPGFWARQRCAACAARALHGRHANPSVPL